MKLVQWEQYMRCDGLPDPASPSAMHTYLHVWRSDEGGRDVEQAINKTGQVLQVRTMQNELQEHNKIILLHVQLLSQIDELLENPEDAHFSLQLLWQEVRQEVRDEQQRRLDDATYGLLRRASRLPTSENEPGVVRFHHHSSAHLVLSLWASLVPPVESVSLSCQFPQLGVSVHLPPQLGGLHAAVRALWLRYDHFSDLCPSREAPPIPEQHNQDLQSLTLAEWQDKLERAAEEAERAKLLEEEQAAAAAAEQEAKTKEQGVEVEAVTATEETEPEIEGEDGEESTSTEPLKDEQAEREKAEREAITRPTEAYELNLRKFAVLGGVLHLDLLEQPPQPRELSKHLALTVRKHPHLRAFYGSCGWTFN
ncbi:hypothetical protein B566_EDAN015490 [Ephemera danica]|nr:hypothetical protein B566_EDAN015490 [Ephemera danica]